MGSVRLTGESDIDCSFCFFARTSTYKRRKMGRISQYFLMEQHALVRLWLLWSDLSTPTGKSNNDLFVFS